MKVKTWTINTYERRCNHTQVELDLLHKTEEMSLEEMHKKMDLLSCLFPGDYYDQGRYEMDITMEDGRNLIVRPMPATYEEVN